MILIVHFLKYVDLQNIMWFTFENLEIEYFFYIFDKNLINT